MPAYQLNLEWESDLASIADVVPSVLILINKYERAQVDSEPRELCYFLVHYLKEKFNYELNYHVNIIFSEKFKITQ
jgi:hypothetical protein